MGMVAHQNKETLVYYQDLIETFQANSYLETELSKNVTVGKKDSGMNAMKIMMLKQVKTSLVNQMK